MILFVNRLTQEIILASHLGHFLFHQNIVTCSRGKDDYGRMQSLDLGYKRSMERPLKIEQRIQGINAPFDPVKNTSRITPDSR